MLSPYWNVYTKVMQTHCRLYPAVMTNNMKILKHNIDLFLCQSRIDSIYVTPDRHLSNCFLKLSVMDSLPQAIYPNLSLTILAVQKFFLRSKLNLPYCNLSSIFLFSIHHKHGQQIVPWLFTAAFCVSGDCYLVTHSLFLLRLSNPVHLLCSPRSYKHLKLLVIILWLALIGPHLLWSLVHKAGSNILARDQELKNTALSKNSVTSHTAIT